MKNNEVIIPKNNLDLIRKRFNNFKQRSQSTGFGGKQTTFLDTKNPGEYLIRILPSKFPEQNFALIVGYHKKIFFANDNGNNVLRSAICPSLTADLPCPICEEIERLKVIGDPESEERIKDLNPFVTVYVNVLTVNREIVGGKAVDKPVLDKVSIYGMYDSIYSDLMGYVLDPTWGDICDWREGNTITLTRTLRKNSSSCDTELKPSPLKSSIGTDEQIKDLITNKMVDMSFLIKRMRSYEDTKIMFETTRDVPTNEQQNKAVTQAHQTNATAGTAVVGNQPTVQQVDQQPAPVPQPAPQSIQTEEVKMPAPVPQPLLPIQQTVPVAPSTPVAPIHYTVAPPITPAETLKSVPADCVNCYGKDFSDLEAKCLVCTVDTECKKLVNPGGVNE